MRWTTQGWPTALRGGARSGEACVDDEVEIEVTPDHAFRPGDTEGMPVQVMGVGVHEYASGVEFDPVAQDVDGR